MAFRLERPEWLLLALLGIPLLLFFLVPRGGRTRSTPFLDLWEQAFAEASPWERFLSRAPGLQVVLVAGAVLFASLAAAGLAGRAAGGGTYHLVLDVSASMSARSPSGKTRVEEAKGEALRFLAERLPGDRVSLSLLGSALRPIVAANADLAPLRDALAELRPERAATDFALLRKALDGVTGDAILLSDGVGQNLESLEGWGPLVARGVGEASSNSGFVRLVGEDPWPKKQIPLDLSVRNFSDAPVGRELVLEIEGNELERRKISLEAGEERRQAFSLPRGEGGTLRARILPEDAYALDADLQLRILPPPRSPLVLLRGEGAPDPFLRAAAEALSEETGVPLRSVTGLEEAPSGAVVLAEGGAWTIPPEAEGRYLLFGSALESIVGDPVRERPAVLDWSRESPLTAGLHFDFLACRRALSVRGEVVPLLLAADGALVYTAERGRSRLFGTAFRLADSNLPVQANFPVLFRRAYAWLLGMEETPPQEESFLDRGESEISPKIARGPSRAVTPGPGVREDLAPLCLLLALLCTALRGLLHLFIR